MTGLPRLAIDGVGAKHSGAATVLLSVVDGALRSNNVGGVVTFVSPERCRRFALPLQRRLNVIEVPHGERGPAGRMLWQNLFLPRAVNAARADALLCLSGGGVPPGHVPCATLVQQSLPFEEEALTTLSLGQRLRVRAIRVSMARSVHASRLVIVQTKHMAGRVRDVLGVPPSKILVVEPCSSLRDNALDAVTPAEMLRLAREDRLLYVGNDSAYKNLRVLAPALRAARQRYPDLTLFATGTDRGAALEPGIQKLPFLDGPRLRGAYEGALALVMPSLCETVGLPLLEAAEAGLPVLAADRPYAREVCGPAAIYFDPHDPGSLAKAILEVRSSPTLRRELAEAGLERAASRARGQPYDRMVEAVLALA